MTVTSCACLDLSSFDQSECSSLHASGMYACVHSQTEDYLRIFSDRKLTKEHRLLFEGVANQLAKLAYDCLLWVDSKWHLIACRFNFPMHLSFYNTLLDCMEQVSAIRAFWHGQVCMPLMQQLWPCIFA
jgi:hypothetical protein